MDLESKLIAAGVLPGHDQVILAVHGHTVGRRCAVSLGAGDHLAEKPAENASEDVKKIYADLLKTYEAVSANFDESFDGITWVDYNEMASYDAFKAQSKADGKVFQGW